jgi:hypothetical protein
MKKCITAIVGLLAIATPVAVVAQVLSPTSASEENATAVAKNGTTQPAHISVQSWAIGARDAAQEIPLRGFYVAHLISGHISAMTDGQASEHLAEDYWTVKLGGTMKVKTLGEAAVLETIVVSKQ